MDSTYTALTPCTDRGYSLFDLRPLPTAHIRNNGRTSPEDLHNIASDIAIERFPNEDYTSQAQAMSLERTLDSQYSPESFDFLDMSADEAMPDFLEFCELGCQRNPLFHGQQDTELVVPSPESGSASTNNDEEQARHHTIPVTKAHTGDYTLMEHYRSEHTVQAVCSRNDLQHRSDILELLSIKATINSDIRGPTVPLSSCERGYPNEADTTRFLPSLYEGRSLLDCWLAGIGEHLEFRDDIHRNCSYPSSISLTVDHFSSVSASDSRAESICSSTNRATLGPRQGRRKRPAPAEDSTSSADSSHMSKRTHSSITCPNCCGASFKRPWNLQRHLTASCPEKQMVKKSWICGPLSHSDDGEKCPVCQLHASDAACIHRMAECWGRTEAGCVTFYRRDAIKTHLMNYHNLRDDENKANQLADLMEYN